MSEQYPNYTNPNDLYNETNTRNGGEYFDGTGMEAPEDYNKYQEEYYYPNNSDYLNDNQNYMSQYYPPDSYGNEFDQQLHNAPEENDYSRNLTSYGTSLSKNKKINTNSRQYYDQAGNFIPVDSRHHNKDIVYSSSSRISKGGNEQSRVLDTVNTSNSLSSYEKRHDSRKKQGTHKERKKLMHEKELRDYKAEKKNERESKERRKKKREKLRRKMQQEEEKSSKKKHSSNTKKCKASHLCNQCSTLLPLKGCALENCCHNKYSESSCCYVNPLCIATTSRCGIKVKPHLKQEKYHIHGVPVENLNDCHHFCKNISTPTSVMPHCVSSSPTAMSYPFHCDHILAPCQPTGPYQQVTPSYPNVMSVPMARMPQMMVASPNHYQEFINASPNNGQLISQTTVCHNPPMEHIVTPQREAVCGTPMEAGKLVYATFPENMHMNNINMHGSTQQSYQMLSKPPNNVFTSVCQPDHTKQSLHDIKELRTMVDPHVSANSTVTFGEKLPEKTGTFIPISDQEQNVYPAGNTQYVVAPLQTNSQQVATPLQTTSQHVVTHLPPSLQQEVVHSAMGSQQPVVYSPLNQMPTNIFAPRPPGNVSFVEANSLQKSNNDMFIRTNNDNKLLHTVKTEVHGSQFDQQSNISNSDLSQKKIVYLKNPIVDHPVGPLRVKQENCMLVKENSWQEPSTTTPRMYYNIVRASEAQSSGDYPLPATEHRNLVVKKINNACKGKSLVESSNKKKTDNVLRECQSVRKVEEFCPSVIHQSEFDGEISYYNKDALANCCDKYVHHDEPLKFAVRKCNSGSVSGCFECSSCKNDNGPTTCREHTVSVISNQRERYPSALRANHGENRDFKVSEPGKKIVHVSDDNKKKENDQVTYFVKKESSDCACHPSVYFSQKRGSESVKFDNCSKQMIVEACDAPSVNSKIKLEETPVIVTPSSNCVIKNSHSMNDFSCCKVKTLDTSKNCIWGCKLDKNPVKVVEVAHPNEIIKSRSTTNIQISSAANCNVTENQMSNPTYSIERFPRNLVTFRRNYSNKSPRKSFKKEFKKIYVVDSLNDSREKVYSVEKKYDNHQNFSEGCSEMPTSIYRNTFNNNINFSPPSSYLGSMKNIASNMEHQVFECRPYTRKPPEQTTVDTLLPPPPKATVQCFSVHGASIPDAKDISCLKNIKPCNIDDSGKTTLNKSFSYNTENLKQKIKDENLRLKREIQSLRRAVNRGFDNENNVSDMSVEEQNLILQHQIRVLGKAIHDFAERLPDSDEGGKLIEELAYQFNVSLDELQKMNVMLRQREKMFNTNTYTKNGVDENARLNAMNRINIQAADDIRNEKNSFICDKKGNTDGRPCFTMVDFYRTPIEADDIRHEMALVDDLIGQSQRIIAEATDTLWLTEYSIKTVLDEFFALMEVNGEKIVEMFGTSQNRQMYMNELKKTVEKHLISLFKTRTNMDKIQEQITNIKANAWNPKKNLPYCSCRPRRDILEDDINHLMERLHEAGNQACEMREKLLRVELANLVSKAETIDRRGNDSVGGRAVGNKCIQKLSDECQMLREKVLYLNHQLHLEKGKQKLESTTDGQQNAVLASKGWPENYKLKSKFNKERKNDNKTIGYISGTTLPIAKDDDSISTKNVNQEIHRKVSDFKTTCDVIQQNLNRIPNYAKDHKGSHNRLIRRMYDRLNFFKKTIERIEWGINQSNDLKDVQGLSLEIQDLIQEIGQQDFMFDNNTSESSFYTPSDCLKKKIY